MLKYQVLLIIIINIKYLVISDFQIKLWIIKCSYIFVIK